MKLNSILFLQSSELKTPFIEACSNYFSNAHNTHNAFPIVRSFADKEIFIDYPKSYSPAAQLVCVQFKFDATLSINDQFMGLLLAASTLKSNHNICVVPYLPYSRHDRNRTQINDSTTVLSLLQSVGITRCITSDIHNEETLQSSPLPLTSIRLTEFWAKLLRPLLQDDMWSIAAPDEGAYSRTQELAQALSCPIIRLKKERYAVDQTKVITIDGEIKSKKIIILDDIIDTAGTAINTLEALLENGAEAVVGCFAHAVLSNNAYERLAYSRFHHIYITDSIDLPYSFDTNKITRIPFGSWFAQKVEHLLETDIPQ